MGLWLEHKYKVIYYRELQPYALTEMEPLGKGVKINIFLMKNKDFGYG
jgi:hypothetical protein